MLCPECRRIGRQCFQCRTYREEREQSIQRTNEAVQRLTRRVEALERTQDPSPPPTGYEDWSNARILDSLLMTGDYSFEQRAHMCKELAVRLDRVVE